MGAHRTPCALANCSITRPAYPGVQDACIVLVCQRWILAGV